MTLNQWQTVVDLDDVPADKLHDVLSAVLDHLDLEIIAETTPDYTAYEVRKRESTR